MTQEIQRGPVSPMQVIYNQEKGLLPSQLDQDAGHRKKQPQSILTRLRGQRRAGQRGSRLSPAEQAVDKLQVGTERALHSFGDLLEIRQEGFDKGQIRKSEVLITAAVAHVPAVAQGNRPQLFQEPGLADAGLPLDQHHPRIASESFCKTAL